MNRVIQDSIRHGETYEIAAQPRAEYEQPILMDDTWSARLRVTKETQGGEVILDADMAIVDGAALASIDTGDAPWEAGIYYYDVRLTDPDGHDVWSDLTRLHLWPRNAPASV